MYPAWYVEDIRLLIFELLETGDLARLARTHKVLFHDATDRIWETIRSAIPFTYCLPQQMKCRKLQIEDVERLDMYARKVKSLIIESNKRRQPSGRPPKLVGKSWREVWTEIAQLRPNALFLPNLVHLRLEKVYDTFLLPLVGIAGSHLASIHIKDVPRMRLYRRIQWSESVVRGFLDGLQDTSKLEHFFVANSELGPAPSRLITSSALRHLHPRNAQCYEEILRQHQHCTQQFLLRPDDVSKPSLGHLTSTLIEQWCDSSVKNLDRGYLSGIRSLALDLTIGQRTAMENCQQMSSTRFVQNLDYPELCTLEITFAQDVSAAIVSKAVEAAKKNGQPKSLSDLNLHGGWFNNRKVCRACLDPQVTAQRLIQAMTPLLPMTNLRSLQLATGLNFLKVLDLPFYRLMADGLPNLWWLDLGYNTASYTLKKACQDLDVVPLRNVAAFCHRIPTLIDVKLRFMDASASVDEDLVSDWISPNVEHLRFDRWYNQYHWVDGERRKVDGEQLVSRVQTYFPNVHGKYLVLGGTNWRGIDE